MKNYGDNRGECYRPRWIKASEFCIIHVSIYTPSDLVDLSNLIGALHFLASGQWVSSASAQFFRERSFKSRLNPRVYFLQDKKRLRRIQNGVSPFTVAEFCARCIVYNFRLFAYNRPFRELSVSYKEKFVPIIKVNFWQTNLRANVCRFSTLQVNRKTNATGRRRLTSSNRAAIFVSTSREKRHNKRWKNLFGYKLGESTENNKGLTFFLR